MEGFQGMLLTVLGVILGAWLFVGILVGLMYNGPRVTSVREGRRY